MNFFDKIKYAKKLILFDLYRYNGKISLKIFFKNYLLTPGFNYMVWFRISNYWNNAFIKYILYKKSIRYGIQIPRGTKIDEGFYIGHFGTIVVSVKCIIGKNCNISQGVTIGYGSRGKNKGYPVIGDNCYIGPGAKLIGSIIIGNNVAIGANAVVTKDILDNGVAVGVPAKVISYNGSSGYVMNKVEEYKNKD